MEVKVWRPLVDEPHRLRLGIPDATWPRRVLAGCIMAASRLAWGVKPPPASPAPLATLPPP